MCGCSQLLVPWLPQRGGCTLGKVLVGVGTDKVLLLGGELFRRLYPRTRRCELASWGVPPLSSPSDGCYETCAHPQHLENWTLWPEEFQAALAPGLVEPKHTLPGQTGLTCPLSPADGQRGPAQMDGASWTPLRASAP